MSSPLAITRNDEFKKDWESNMTTRELARKYGVNDSVPSRHARRLGLKPRYAKRTRERTHALEGGQWVPNERGVMIWRVDK